MSDYNSSLPIRTENNGDAAVKIVDGTVTSQQLTVNADGSLNITDNAGSLTVDQSSHDNLNANANIQVNNTDVGNANPVPVSDAGGSLTVDALNLDIRDLTHVSDSVKIGDGTDLLAINTDGSLNVVVQEDVGTEVVDYNTAAAVAAGATDNHDVTFASASRLYQVLASASGKLKIEIQIETGSATGVFNTILVAFNSTATPNINLNLSKYAAIPLGARVRVIRKNIDNQAQDVYSTVVAILG